MWTTLKIIGGCALVLLAGMGGPVTAWLMVDVLTDDDMDDDDDE